MTLPPPVVSETDEYAVTVENTTHEGVPEERRRVYFIRNKRWGVVELTTPLLGEAIANMHMMQTLLSTANDRPSDAVELCLTARGNKKKGDNGLN